MSPDAKLFREIRASIVRSAYPNRVEWKKAVLRALRAVREFRRQEAKFMTKGATE